MINLLKVESDLNILLELIDGYWRSPLRISGKDSEFIRIWSLYRKLRSNLVQIDKEMFEDLREFEEPNPDTSNSMYSGGIFHKEKHLKPMYNETIRASSYFNSFLKAVKKNNVTREPLEYLKLISRNFRNVARQLQSRYSNRSTISIDDEYDVQDLFHSLLRLFFEDIRPEEWTPSYAGSSNRMDFLLKNEKIVSEIKKTRKGLDAKTVGEQLIIDIKKYETHPDCKTLFCFVYDPDGRISNPRGLENDLSKKHGELNVIAVIEPK